MSRGSPQVSSSEKAQVAVAAALSALEAELERSRAGSGTVSNEKQLSTFRQILIQMAQSLKSGDLPNRMDRHPGMGAVVVDSWPFDSELGELIIAAERAYLKA